MARRVARPAPLRFQAGTIRRACEESGLAPKRACEMVSGYIGQTEGHNTAGLMRRNILTYKAPPHNEGYDLICIHPDPQKVTKQIRIQVKSRYATDCDRSLQVKGKTFTGFDFLVAVFLNILSR